MLYVVNYRGRQVHSPQPIDMIQANLIVFRGGGTAGLASCQFCGCTLVSPWEDGFIRPGQRVGDGIVVADVTPDGKWVYAKTAGASMAASADGKYSVHLGDPGGGQRGVQVGEGDTQFNEFR